MIEIKHLKKVFDDDTIPLRDINVTINNGDVISIIGPSGTGKSTLAREIALHHGAQVLEADDIYLAVKAAADETTPNSSKSFF